MAHNPNLTGFDEAAGPTRVRVAAQDALVSDALAGALSHVEGIAVVGAEDSAHVIVWDTGSERSDVTEMPAQLLAAQREVPVLALAHDEAQASALLAAGVRGAVARHASAARLAAAATALRYGMCVLDGELASAGFAALVTDPEPVADEAGLTAREREVLALLALGLSNKSIARRLQVSIHTVKFHVNSILVKLDADSRTAAVTTAVRRGLVTL